MLSGPKKVKCRKTAAKKQAINIQRLCYIKSGAGYMVSDKGECRPLLPGHIYLFPYNCNQEVVVPEQAAIDRLYVDFTTIPPILALEPLVYPVSDSSALMHLMEILEHYLPVCSPGSPGRAEPVGLCGRSAETEHISEDETKQVLHSLVQSLLTILSNEKEIPYSNDPVVVEALSFIRDHHTEPIHMETVAGQLGYTVPHFIRRFRAAVGITPYAYLRHCRLVHADELIAQGMSLSMAAQTVGYTSVTSLSRSLKDIRDKNR